MWWNVVKCDTNVIGPWWNVVKGDRPVDKRLWTTDTVTNVAINNVFVLIRADRLIRAGPERRQPPKRWHTWSPRLEMPPWLECRGLPGGLPPCGARACPTGGLSYGDQAGSNGCVGLLHYAWLHRLICILLGIIELFCGLPFSSDMYLVQLVDWIELDCFKLRWPNWIELLQIDSNCFKLVRLWSNRFKLLKLI